MILSSTAQNEIFAECEVCRREIGILKSEVATETPERIELRGNVQCACCNVSSTISKTVTSHAAMRRQLGDLHLLLAKRDLLTGEQKEITEALANIYPKYPLRERLIKGGLFVGKFAGILAIIGAIAEAAIFAIAGVMFMLSKFFEQVDLFEMANNVLNRPNEYFINQGWKWMEKGEPFDFDVFALVFKTSREFEMSKMPYAILGLFLTIVTLTIWCAVIREGVVLGFWGWHLYKKHHHTKAVEAYRPTGTQRLEQIEGELYDVNEQIDLSDIVPRNYLSTPAVETILNYFADNRVDDLRGALNLYHEERIKQEQSDILREILAETRSSKKYTRALYSFSINPYDHQVTEVDD